MAMGRHKAGDTETNFAVRSRDAAVSIDQYRRLPKLPLYFVLDNLRSAFNVGSIFRLADCLRITGLYLCGCTAHPPHIKLEKTSMGTVDYVTWHYAEKTGDAIASLKGLGIRIWAAETSAGACRYETAEYPAPLALVLGNEALGIGPEVLGLCDAVVEVPVYGFKNSLNVAQSASVIGYRIAETWAAQKKDPRTDGPRV
jgi:23S rRNA (guanosine2251-2'-O)-methyltransferase